METDRTKAAGILISCPEQVMKLAVVHWQAGEIQLVGADVIAQAEGIGKAFDRIDEIAGGSDVPVVVGVDSSQVRFMDVSLPPVNEAQFETLLKVQVETKLPVSVDQMSLAWVLKKGDEGVDCTVCATKKEWIDAAMVYRQERTHCTVDAAGATEICQQALGEQGPHVLLEEQGSRFLMSLACGDQMRFCTVIDAEIDSDTNVPLEELAVQDILMTLDDLHLPGGKPSVSLLAKPGRRSEALKERLSGSGWSVAIYHPDELLSKVISNEPESEVDLKAIGLAMHGFCTDRIEYDFSRVVRQEAQRKQAQAGAFKLRNALAITIGFIVLSMAFSYWSVKKEVRMLENVLAAQTNDTSAEQILKEQQFRESIARSRPDMMDLWDKIQACQEGILLDTFEFEKGKPIKITAKGGNYESVYKFQKALESQNGISQVKLLEPRFNEKEKKTNFTMTFKYKHFCQ